MHPSMYMLKKANELRPISALVSARSFHQQISVLASDSFLLSKIPRKNATQIAYRHAILHIPDELKKK